MPEFNPGLDVSPETANNFPGYPGTFPAISVGLPIPVGVPRLSAGIGHGSEKPLNGTPPQSQGPMP
ncbi:hypothetical protein [Amycolatopsis sp. NPDC004378]